MTAYNIHGYHNKKWFVERPFDVSLQINDWMGNDMWNVMKTSFLSTKVPTDVSTTMGSFTVVSTM